MEKGFRLRARADFQKVRSEGRSWVHPLMVLCVFPNTLGYNRFGFSVSRRIGNAVTRNRVKRRMRETVRLLQGDLCRSWDVVLIARSPIADVNFDSIRQATEALFRRACLLKSHDCSARLDD